MRILFSVLAATIIGLAIGFWLGQPRDYRGPRYLDGHPDLNGVWQVMNSANYDIEPHAARAAMALRTDAKGRKLPVKDVVLFGAVGSVPAGLGVVEGGAIPYTPEARRIRDENQLNWLQRDPEIQCFLPGVPRANYMALPFQIVQSEKAMLFAYEYAGATRNIYLEDPGPAPIQSWMGQSYGKWDGDTFVVEVTGQNGETWLDRAGNHHSDQLHVTERFRLSGPNTMEYEATLTDPKVYTRPWKMKMTLYKRVGDDARLQQFKCTEFVEELRYGHLRKVEQ